MIPAVMTDEAFLADVRAADRDDDGFRLWWLGQSGFLLQHRKRHLLFDPYLSDSLTAKYAGSDRPHLRMTQNVIAPERLDFIDLVLVSHQHTDHLDGDTLRPMLRSRKEMEVVVPAAHRGLAAQRLEVPADRLRIADADRTFELSGFRIHGVLAAHDLPERDLEGRAISLGYIVQFGGWTIYHAGDCCPYDGLEKRLSEFAVDVAILPINGRADSRRVAGNFWGDEAAGLAHRIGARLVIPCHYRMFSFNSTTPDTFVAACHRLNQPYALPQVGERWDSVALR